MSWTAFLWAVVCRFQGHQWGEWKPFYPEHLVEACRCRCGIERTRRRGLV